MPRNITLRVTDPNTGKTHEIRARQGEKINNISPDATDGMKANPKDGVVDLFVRADRAYGGTDTRHITVEANSLSNEAARALDAAIQAGTAGAVKLGGEGSRISVRGDVATELVARLGSPHDPSQSLAGSDNLLLGTDGRFSVGAEGLRGELAAMTAAARNADGLSEGQNLFSANGVSPTTKAAALEQVQGLLARVEADTELGANEKVAARAAGATITHELIRSLGNNGPEGALKKEAFGAYKAMVAGETHVGLRESMIFNAVQQKAFLPEAMRADVDAMKAEIAPSEPPYAHWFKDGKRELNISYAAGHGEGFYEGITEFMKGKGFEKVEEGNYRNPRLLQMKKNIGGEIHTVNIHLRHFSKDSFKDINDPKMDMVVYGGHSNLGDNTRRSLENAPEGTGEGKLIFLGLCSGKDNLDGVRKAFPEAQAVTTFNSSYFNTKPNAAGKKQFYTGEDARALVEIINGSLLRKDWTEIGDNIRKNALGWNHGKELGNYLTPIDTQFNARFQDSDKDGVANSIDRHFDVETIEVAAQPSSSLEPREPKAGALRGEAVARAAHFANTIDLYNPTYDKFSHKGRIISDGFYSGSADDPVVKFDTVVEDGRSFYKLQVNDKYAGASEELLRSMTMIEYHNHLRATEPGFPHMGGVENAMTALMTGVASLKYDAGRNDQATFNVIKEHYGIPEGVELRDAKAILAADHKDYTGSLRLAKKWIDKLDGETMAAMKERFDGQ